MTLVHRIYTLHDLTQLAALSIRSVASQRSMLGA